MADMDELPDLDVLEQFVRATYVKDQDRSYRNIGKLPCPTCGDSRRDPSSASVAVMGIAGAVRRHRFYGDGPNDRHQCHDINNLV